VDESFRFSRDDDDDDDDDDNSVINDGCMIELVMLMLFLLPLSSSVKFTEVVPVL
jgi:hypothetical protein